MLTETLPKAGPEPPLPTVCPKCGGPLGPDACRRVFGGPTLVPGIRYHLIDCRTSH